MKSLGVAGWLLIGLALALAAVTAALAVDMFLPVPWDRFGVFGAVALSFSLHLLVVTAIAAALTGFALWNGAKRAAALFALVALLGAGMAIVPSAAVWQQARELGVPLSLVTYVENATHINIGRPQPERSVSYGTAADGTRLVLDVWRADKPAGDSLRPAVVMVHGGGWSHGNRSDMPMWNRWLNQLGYEVFDVEYRMPPPERWRDEVGDVKCALGWVAAHAAEYHVDPGRISLMGESAGANLAMLAAFSMGDPRLPPSCVVPPVAVRTVVNRYGPVDLTLLHDTSGSLNYVRNMLKQYVGGTPSEHADRYRLISPIAHVGERTPPTITLHGLMDRTVPVAQAQLLDGVLAAAGVPHETYLLPASDHGFDINWGGFGTQVAQAKIKDFLQRH